MTGRAVVLWHWRAEERLHCSTVIHTLLLPAILLGELLRLLLLLLLVTSRQWMHHSTWPTAIFTDPALRRQSATQPRPPLASTPLIGRWRHAPSPTPCRHHADVYSRFHLPAMTRSIREHLDSVVGSVTCSWTSVIHCWRPRGTCLISLATIASVNAVVMDTLTS